MKVSDLGLAALRIILLPYLGAIAWGLALAEEEQVCPSERKGKRQGLSRAAKAYGLKFHRAFIIASLLVGFQLTC